MSKMANGGAGIQLNLQTDEHALGNDANVVPTIAGIPLKYIS